MRRPKLGQVFLIDNNIILKILKFVKLDLSQTVLEIGCGDGILTQSISPQVKQLILIEIDTVLIEKTKKSLHSLTNIVWINKDVLDIDFNSFSTTMRVVANIPYYLSAKLIQKFAYSKYKFIDLTLMVQKEFARKCIAQPGSKDYTALTVFIQFHFCVEILFDISKNSFNPIPKIDSSMMKLTPKFIQNDINLEFFELLVRCVFWGKRKKIATALINNPYKTFDKKIKELDFIIKHSNFRANHLSLDDFIQLYNELTIFGSFK